MSDDGEPLLCGFGCAIVEGDDSTAPFRASIEQSQDVGAPQRWMAPELLNPEARCTTRSDIWAFACLAVEVRIGMSCRNLGIEWRTDPERKAALRRKERRWGCTGSEAT